MNIKTGISVLAVATLLVACDQNGRMTGVGGMGGKETVGTLAGAGLGAWAGSNVGGGTGNVVATAAGTLLGAYLGNEVGSSLDRADMAYYNRTSQHALENAQPGETMPWNNPNSTASGTITPSNYYQTASGRYCREYQQTISVGGQRERGQGTACRQPDGTWQIVN